MHIKILEKTPSSIIYELPPGKPDPHQPCFVCVENRDRVLQETQKGPTCWYYAMNRLRRRMGKCSSAELLSERQIEIIGSNWRKELTEIHKSIPTCTNTFYSDSFTTKNDELLNKYIEINKKLIRNLGVNPDEILQRYGDLYTKTHVIFHSACSLLAKAYHLNKSNWTPFQDIDSLIAELTLNGPLAVEGDLGKECYDELPIKTEEFFEWKDGAKRHRSEGHVIVIIGAKKVQDKAFVYFMDNERNDPKDPSSQKYYKISYKELTSHIADLNGKLAKEPSKAGYGYHGNFLL